LFADKEFAIFLQPLAKRRLAQQRLVRDLHDVDILPVGGLAAVRDQQTLFDKAVDQRSCFDRDLIKRRHPAHELASRIGPAPNEVYESGARQSLRAFWVASPAAKAFSTAVSITPLTRPSLSYPARVSSLSAP